MRITNEHFAPPGVGEALAWTVGENLSRHWGDPEGEVEVLEVRLPADRRGWLGAKIRVLRDGEELGETVVEIERSAGWWPEGASASADFHRESRSDVHLANWAMTTGAALEMFMEGNRANGRPPLERLGY